MDYVTIRYQQIKPGGDGPELIWAEVHLPLDGCIHTQTISLGPLPAGEFQFTAAVAHQLPQPLTAAEIASALVAELAYRLREPEYSEDED